MKPEASLSAKRQSSVISESKKIEKPVQLQKTTDKVKKRTVLVELGGGFLGWFALMLLLVGGGRLLLCPPEPQGVRTGGVVLFLVAGSVLAWAATLLSLCVFTIWRRRVAWGILSALAANAIGSMPLLAGEPLFCWALAWIPFFVCRSL